VKILVLFIIVVSVIFMASAAALMLLGSDDGFTEEIRVVGELPKAAEHVAEPLVYIPEPGLEIIVEPMIIIEAEPEPELEPITLATFIPAPERCERLQALTTQRVEIPRGAEYFDNAIFIGDSITTGYRIWREHITVSGETLGNTVIFANGSYGIHNALREVSSGSIHPEFGGVQMRPEDAVAESGAERVFISLGLNDVLWDLESFLDNYTLLLNRIINKNPGAEIIILPVPPYMHEAQPSPDRNARIAEYNNALIVLAYEMGLSFIDSTAPLRCENGGLKEEFCGDPLPGGQGCHWLPRAYGEVLRFIVENPA